MEGAPNFREVKGQQIFGSAMPTVEGMRQVLRHVGCSPSQQQDVQVLLHDPATELAALVSQQN